MQPARSMGPEPTTIVAEELPAGDERWICRLRREYFAKASEPALRYEVSLKRLLEHVDAALSNRPTPARVRRPEELVLAVACVDNHSLAWRDLVDQFEPVLVRSLSLHGDRIESMLAVRRFLLGLREASRSASGEGAVGLQSFTGDRPMRTWLLERLRANDPRAGGNAAPMRTPAPFLRSQR